jgi:superfamily II DNA or RNA helicase
VPPQGARGTIVSATGSGKTITAAACALESFADGRILVTVPTLDLLVQTAQAWRLVGHRGPMVAVCSLEKDAVLDSLGVRTTTNPIQLALWVGHGPVVVFATYASLVDREEVDAPEGRRKVRGPLEAALAGGGRLYGQRMAGFDLAIVDEAHGTAGDLGRPWAAIHDNARIPADFRLHLTATPRILAAPRPQKGADGREVELATMADDPDGTYGAWLAELGLSEAIEREILAGFAIDVLEIRDPSPVLGESEEARRGRRLALLQTALLEHAAAHNLRTVMTFHQKVEETAAFAEKLPETAAELYANDATDEDLAAADRLPKSSIGAGFYELEAGRHVPPNRMWSAWLCGDHTVAERREKIRQFANGIDTAGRRVHRAFLASVRVLGEGVDITGERGVDSICFADTRGSQVEIVQNIGRALRLNKDGSTKVARIIVPVFLEPGEDPTDMVASASFKPLVAVLQGLRSHDERLVEQLASRALTSGKRKVHVRRDGDGRIVGAGGAADTGKGQEPDEGADAAAGSALLHFSSPRDAATIAAFLRTRVYRPQSLVWLEGYQALLRWRKRNEITGLYAVPYDVEAEVGVTKAFPPGRWVHQQRKALRAVSWRSGARRCSTCRRPGWSGSRARKPGRTSSPRCGPTGGPWGTSRHGRTPSGTTPLAAAPSPSDSTWPTSGARAASARTRSGPPCAHSSWPPSTPTGTAPGHSTGSGITASSPTSSTPTATPPTSPPASPSTATTSDGGDGGSASPASGRSCLSSSRNGSPHSASTAQASAWQPPPRRNSLRHRPAQPRARRRRAARPRPRSSGA